jgi:asparagine synthase (glutamine-hydrolysing)
MRGYLPEDIVKRPKRGLRAPVAEWLRGELPEFATEMLSEDDLRKKGYFNPDTVIRLLGRHRAGDGSYDSPLLAVLSIQLWDDLFLHGCRPP